MRYAVGATGTKSEFDQLWYIAQGFGNPTTYGFHEGEDINLKTGGDTDLGQELKAISAGRIIYYHYSSHPTTGFGRHLVVKIDGAWGTRWVHYAHCLDFNPTARDVAEGEIIAKLGKSGTSAAHLHFAIYKVDPATVGGIDNIANTLTELNNVWEEPTAFIDRWMQPQPTPQPVITDETRIPQINNMTVAEIKNDLTNKQNLINEQNLKLNQIRALVG